MPNFRKKPVVIEARQMTSPVALIDIMRWIDASGGRTREWCWDGEEDTGLPPERYLVIKTLEGDHKAQEGDWVIKGVAGEFYPCKPEIFAATYEAA